MKCFIHKGVEALAVCKRCGKAMCDECSAYSGHSGICPECRKQDFILETNQINTRLKALKKEIIWGLFKTIIFFWLIIPLAVGLFNYFKRKKEREALTDRLNLLNGEIARLNSILNSTGGPAFI